MNKKNALKALGITLMVLGLYVTAKINGWAAVTNVLTALGAMAFVLSTKGYTTDDVKDDVTEMVDDVKEEIDNLKK